MTKLPKSELILYETEDGKTRVRVVTDGETVWLSQDQMAELFDTDRTSITKHIKNIFDTNELDQTTTSAKFAQVLPDGRTYQVQHYNLDVIISVGYRISSVKGTQFRIWATQRLREYIIKGFALDDERLKQGDGRARYFEELLQRIRDIRSSERNFYQKVTDIYATSIDYKKDAELTQQFFATVQNKMHYAVHGNTAAELISRRVDAKKANMGLTNFKGNYITVADTHIAKNYLSEPELKQLNLIVSLFLDFAELQATNERTMKMSDWITKLDDFLKLSEKQILTNLGHVSAKTAEKKASTEYKKYRQKQNKDKFSDFDRETQKILKMEKNKRQ